MTLIVILFAAVIALNVWYQRARWKMTLNARRRADAEIRELLFYW